MIEASTAEAGTSGRGADPVVNLTGEGRTWWDHLNRYSPNTVQRISGHVRAAIRNGAISTKMRELIYIGVDSVVTHLYPKGVALHAERAIEAGATTGEIIEVLQLACGASSRSYATAIGIVADEIAAAGLDAPVPAEDERVAAQAFKQQFIESEGFWEPWMDFAIERVPTHFTAWLRMNYAPGEPRELEPKARALISMALAVCAAMADEAGIRRHARLALRHGATAAEVYEAMQLATGLGPHAFSNAIPVLQPLFDDATPAAQ